MCNASTGAIHNNCFNSNTFTEYHQNTVFLYIFRFTEYHQNTVFLYIFRFTICFLLGTQLVALIIITGQQIMSVGDFNFSDKWMRVVTVIFQYFNENDSLWSVKDGQIFYTIIFFETQKHTFLCFLVSIC